MNTTDSGHQNQRARVLGIELGWEPGRGACKFDGLPVAMMWIDSTLAGMMQGFQSMVGTPRFLLALQSQGRRSVEADWEVISRFPDFREGFAAIANIAAVAGWGRWELIQYDPERRECRFRARDSWEGRYQQSAGVCWGSALLAGKLAGYCSKLFGANCWADQTAFLANGDECDEFVVTPSSRGIEAELENLLATDEATRADMAVALERLQQEVAERRRMEDSVRVSEARFRALLEAASDGIHVLDEQGNVVEVNDAFCRMLGYPREELLRLNVARWDVECPTGKIAAKISELTDEPRVFETRHRRKDGEVREVEISVVGVTLENRRLLYASARDITERKRSADALRTANQQLRLLANNLREAVLAYDMNRRLIFVNPAVESLTGYSCEDLRRENFICWIHPEDRERMLGYWDDLFRGGSFAGVEYRLIARDGRNKWAEAAWGPLFDEAGRQVGVQGSERDITDRKRAEEEKERLHLQLQQMQRLESIGRLAGGVAHDFNNLLTVINGYSDVILGGLQEGDPLRDSLIEIRNAGSRAAELTRQLLTFSRKQATEPQAVNLNGLIVESREMFRRMVGEDIEVRTDLVPELGAVMMDPVHLYQVLMNLIVNARDAMPEGGRLTIKTSTRECNEETAASCPDVRAGHYAVLAVSDTGLGLSEEVAQKAFEPFFTTKEEGKGTGLGLSTVYGIVRQAGGWVQVESEPGQGATFSVGLPFASEPATETTHSISLPDRLEGSETVLVVEDQDEVRKLAVTVLKSYRYRTLEARSGGEALLIAENHPGPIHLMLTDVIMPQMTGTQLAARLRPIRPEMRVLYMSGYTADVITGQGALDPGIDYVEKPFRPEVLALKVRTALGALRSRGRVLVVDDIESVRKLFESILTSHGYEVMDVGDGAQATDLLRQQAFDVVITDLVMPNREGIETIQALRKSHPGLKIIAVSGAFGGSFLRAAAMVGAHAALVKPVSPAQLLAAVRKVLA